MVDISDLYGTGKRRREARLEPLKLVQALEIDEFLEFLNRKAPPRKFLVTTEPGDIPPTTQEILRGWVDEWLDSAKDEHGGEDPQKRSFDKANGPALAALEYSEQGRFHLVASGNSLRPWFDTFEREPTTPYRALLGPRPDLYAKQQLVFFLLSDVRFRLAKCRKEHCGTYFLLKHWNRHYAGGTLCDSCKRSRSEQSAIKATAEVRELAKAQLHYLAATKFAKQIRSSPDWHQQKELKVRLANFLNTRIERSDALRAVYRDGITAKWVSRFENWNAIETAAKGEK
jgi:hypothetical protein